MEKICRSLKEAIEITFDKYNYEKSEENYKNILNLLLSGKYHYITSDFGAREFVSNKNTLIYEIEKLYDESTVGNEILLSENVNDFDKINSIASYLAQLNKNQENISFGSLASKIDKLNVDSKAKYLFDLIINPENELKMTSGDVKRLVVENAYRLLRLHMTTSGTPILNLYSDDNVPISQRVDLANQNCSYLTQLFNEINSDNLVEFINNLDNENINYMCYLYEVSRRNYQNRNFTNSADTKGQTKETIAMFNTFSNKKLAEQINLSGISY